MEAQPTSQPHPRQSEWPGGQSPPPPLAQRAARDGSVTSFLLSRPPSTPLPVDCAVKQTKLLRQIISIIGMMSLVIPLRSPKAPLDPPLRCFVLKLVRRGPQLNKQASLTLGHGANEMKRSPVFDETFVVCAFDFGVGSFHAILRCFGSLLAPSSHGDLQGQGG